MVKSSRNAQTRPERLKLGLSHGQMVVSRRLRTSSRLFKDATAQLSSAISFESYAKNVTFLPHYDASHAGARYERDKRPIPSCDRRNLDNFFNAKLGPKCD